MMGGTKINAEAYRIPLPVTEMKVLLNQTVYYVCPRCRTTMDREFCTFCDRCGQRLGWSQYRKAKRID